MRNPKRSGTVTPWLVLSLMGIVGIVAIGMDGGRLVEERRRVQAAADAAALSAGVQNYKNYISSGASASDAALSTASDNGYSNDGVNSIVTVNSPPTSGVFAGKADYFEVIVQCNLRATFGAVFTGKRLAVTARSVARGRPLPIGVMALNSTGAGAFTNKGIGAFVVLNAPLYVNSNDPAAFRQSAIGPITASSFRVVGGNVNPAGGLLLGKMYTGVDPTPDPLAKYPIPNPAGYPTRSGSQLKINSLLPTILQPGVYVGGISISGASIVTMLPGIYIMDGGGFQISGLATLAGLEVMIFNTSVTKPAGPVTFNTSGVVAIVPPLSGTYQGFSIFQDRASTQPVSLTGFGVTSVLGTIYAPSAPLSLTALAGVNIDTLGGAYIAGSVTVGGVASLSLNLGPHFVRVPDVSLVEQEFPMDSRSFLNNLKVSGLLLDEQVAEVSDRFSNSAMEVVVDGLVDQGLLTAYQVKQLHAGQSKGLVLGQYHLLDELGRGGYGCVYRARHKLMDRIVALKVIAPERVEDSHARAWFRREVLAATKLTHPNIALAYDADEIDGILFFAMEYIDGLNLDALVRQQGPVPIGAACEMLLQTAKALQYAHEKGMVHRDIKPANLLIPRSTMADGLSDQAPRSLDAIRPVLVKVVDFGLARLQSSSNNNTLVLQSERGFVGTPAYVSPEQARNIHEVDIRSDLYSLGCTFYHALAGRPPFQASTPVQIVVQHLEKEPEPIENHRPEIPPALASIIRRLMAKKPDKRFQTPGELLRELGFFFYAQDQSGLQRAIQFPAVAAGTSPAVASPAARQETECLATRVFSWDREGKLAADSTEPATAYLSDDALPSIIVPGEATGTATHVAGEPSVAITEVLGDGKLDRSVIQDWTEWASVVADLFARRQPALDATAYRVLHRHLLQGCKTKAASGDPVQAALFRQITDLVQPWLTLATFGGIDPETLASLQKQCRAINGKLGVRHGSYLWIVGAVLLAIAAGASFFLLPNFENLPAPSWSGWIQRHPMASLAAIPVILFSSVFVMRKLLRPAVG